MDETIITRTVKTALLGGLFLFPFIAQKTPPPVAWGFLFGLLASLVNLHLLSAFAQNLLITPSQPVRTKTLFFLAVLKFPLFYGGLASFLYIYRGTISLHAVMLGFSFPLLIILLKKIGRMLITEITQSDGKRTRHAHAA